MSVVTVGRTRQVFVYIPRLTSCGKLWQTMKWNGLPCIAKQGKQGQSFGSCVTGRAKLDIHPCAAVAHPRGAVWGNFHPKRLWLIAVWHPFDINAPLLAPVEVETEIKKYSKLSNALPFLELHDLRARPLFSFYFRKVSTMLFFRNNTVLLSQRRI